MTGYNDKRVNSIEGGRPFRRVRCPNSDVVAAMSSVARPGLRLFITDYNHLIFRSTSNVGEERTPSADFFLSFLRDRWAVAISHNTDRTYINNWSLYVFIHSQIRRTVVRGLSRKGSTRYTIVSLQSSAIKFSRHVYNREDLSRMTTVLRSFPERICQPCLPWRFCQAED